MGLVWSAALKDLRRRLRDPVSLLLWVALPLLVGSMLMLAFDGFGDKPPIKARLLIADEDSTLASMLFRGALERVPVLETEAVNAADGRARLDAGKATALLRIPPGFGDSLLADRLIVVPLVVNPAQSILPRIAEEVVDLVAEAGYYVRRLLAPALPEVRGILTGGAPPTNAQIGGLGAIMNGVFQRGGRYLSPPALKLDMQQVGSDRPRGGWGMLFFPGILFMSLIFMSQGISADVWIESERGTLRRIATAPRPLAAFVAGKVLAGGLLMAGVILIALALGVWAFQIPAARAPFALAWSACAGMAFTALLMVLQLGASSARTANVMTSMVVFPLLMVGGSFFPFETMPAWLARIGRLTPNGWALLQLKGILSGEADPALIGPAFLGLLAITALAVALAPRVLRRRFGMQ
jgi:ABC-type Na+ efflux pump permease subunit